MGTGVFDPSKMQPLNAAPPAAAAPPAPGAMTFDPSKMQPLGAQNTPSTPSEGGLGTYLSEFEEGPAGGAMPGLPGGELLGLEPIRRMIAGGVKSAAQVPATALDLAHGLVPSQHLKDAADWLHQGGQPDGFWEGVGALGEQVLEFIGTDGLLKLAGGAIEGTAAGAKAINAAKQLKAAQQVSETLATHPRLAGIVAVGLKASKDATMMGAQTYAHTEDPGQAAGAAALGGGLGLVAGGMGAAGRYLQKISPKTINLAGEEVPALAEQLNEAGHATGPTKGAPAIAAKQQAAAPKVIRNLAQQATAQAIDHINATRPMYDRIGEAGSLLPAPEGAEPFTFTLEGPGTTETPTGEIAHSAAKTPQAAFKEPRYTTASAPTREPIREPEPTIRMFNTRAELKEFSAKEDAALAKTNAGYRPGVGLTEGSTGADISTATPPAAAGETVGGGGTVKTTSAAQAQTWLRQLEEIQASPMHDEMSATQQAQIETQRKALQDQLGLYHASPYAQRFVAENPWDAMEHVRHFGDAADQIEGTAQPVFQKLDQASGGEFTKWREIAKRAEKTMGSPASEEAYQNAAQKFNEANGNINDLITRHGSEISRADYSAAKNAWREASRLNELHANIERMMGGVTADETASERGLNRVMTGRTRQLENYLNKGTNRQQIEQLIGKEGTDNLKDLTTLLSNAGTARDTTGIAKNVLNVLRGHHLTMGGTIGGGIAAMFGAPVMTGIAAGAAATEGVRWVLRSAATNSNIGNLITYAARHGVSPQIYAPLIARAMVVPFEEPKEEQPEEEAPAKEQ
jgi:hypothetical protein